MSDCDSVREFELPDCEITSPPLPEGQVLVKAEIKEADQSDPWPSKPGISHAVVAGTADMISIRCG